MTEQEYVVNPLLVYREEDSGVTLRVKEDELTLNEAGRDVIVDIIETGRTDGDEEFVSQLCERDVIKAYNPEDPEYFAPEAVAIETSMRCNLECKHCYREAGHSMTKLSIDAIKKAIREAEELGASGVAIGGGEPTLHPEFTEILRTVNDTDMTAFVVTSGTTGVLEEDENVELLKEGIDQQPGKYTVGVSIYGPESFDDEFKGLEGAFENTISTVETVGSAGVQVSLQSVVSKDNREELLELVETTVPDLPIAMFGVQAEKPMGRGKYRSDRVLSASEYAGFRREIQRLWDDAMGDSDVVFNNLPPFPPESDFNRAIAGCSAGTVQTTIDPYGNITACSWFSGTDDPDAFSAGDIYDDSLAETWHEADELWNLRRMESTGKCGSCNGACNRCPAISMNVRGSMHEPDPFCPLVKEGS